MSESKAPDLITTSRMKAFNACRRLHHYAYVLGYRPLVDSESAEFGSIFHKGLEAWWLAWAQGRELLALEEAQAAIGKAAAHRVLLRRGHGDEGRPPDDRLPRPLVAHDGAYQVIAVEREFAAPLPTPEGAKRARGLRVAGKLDVLVRRLADDTVWIVEHKTTTADLTPGSTYWQRLRMDTQVSVYFEGTRILGYEPVGCLYDVISRPQQRPLKATPEDKRKLKKDGTWYANVRLEDESMEDFRARMAEEIAGAPEAYFQRSEVVRLEAELEESRRDTYDTAMMIRETKKADRAPRNPDACFLYNRPCDFYDVCCRTASIEDETRFKRLESVHPELANDNPEAA
jgi:hypothetical protein